MRSLKKLMSLYLKEKLNAKFSKFCLNHLILSPPVDFLYLINKKFPIAVEELDDLLGVLQIWVIQNTVKEVLKVQLGGQTVVANVNFELVEPVQADLRDLVSSPI